MKRRTDAAQSLDSSHGPLGRHHRGVSRRGGRAGPTQKKERKKGSSLNAAMKRVREMRRTHFCEFHDAE